MKKTLSPGGSALKSPGSSSPVSRSGRFAGRAGLEAARFTESISFDWRLWRQDLLGSIAHATMLKRIGVLAKEEHQAIVKGLDDIGQEIADGKFQWQPELEDVHMNIEAELTRRVPAGAKLHTARSRNDQVAVDLRLWLREEIAELADRKSTRLNSSHVSISYAVFCLKKKKKTKINTYKC